MAGLPNGERFDQQAQSRAGLYHSHTSSSVPSTPYQKPRDLQRRYSRSPSPNRALANHSPKSVVSEAVAGAHGSHRGAGGVGFCEFESGAEFRKRRMPYTDDAEKELGPPKKEPRKTLNPVEQDKLSGDMRELYDRLLPSQDSEDRRAKLVAKLDRILTQEWPDANIRVNVFGSSGNLLSSTDSDVDICITTSYKKLESMHSIAALLAKHHMQKVVCRAAAKVPIVKCWDPELHLATDLNVNNPDALQNTRLIKTYVQLDDRVRPLAKIIKYWTKRRILNDAAYGATISSYTWICMIINFLQRRHPPILPSLQNIAGCRLRSETGELSSFADDVDALKAQGASKGWGDANQESLGELLFQFFRHYGFEFQYSEHVVSVREGELVSRKKKGWHRENAPSPQAFNRLCVEEPFTTNRNLGNSADYHAWHGIHLEIRRAFELIDDGLQLEKCCEQFEFPPEEHKPTPLFQRPPPRPPPTLTRSASQSGQGNRDQGNGRSRKANRNTSNQRANGNRRASSGAAYSNQRGLFSPPLGTPSADYFGLKGNLHEQLYQQYQFLQAQQDALRSQLAQQQQQQQQAAQAQARVGDLAGSPRPRPYANMQLPHGITNNGLASPRLVTDNPPQTAPLFPGYLYQYPTRYPPASPMSQARSREGTSTNPSSPSLVAAVPALRRQVHRGSVPDGSASSVRSQSQPGRSLQHPLAMQQQVPLGFDAAAQLAQYQAHRAASMHSQGQNGIQLPFSPFSQTHPSAHGIENAMPKEYVGYYVGQSPQLGPQYPTANQVQPPPMMLQNPPTRQRRVTPDLAPPLPNGRHNSRSPSPLGRSRGYSSTITERRASQPTFVTNIEQAMPNLSTPNVSAGPASATLPPTNVDFGGPVIVNGSGRTPTSKILDRSNGHAGPGRPLPNETVLPIPISQPEDLSRMRPLPLRTQFDTMSFESVEPHDRRTSSPHRSPMSMNGPERLISSLSPNGTSQHLNGMGEHYHESTPLTAAPLLSPVAELRTPSPTQPRGFDLRNSPEANGDLQKATKIANAKQVQKDLQENGHSKSDSRHERKGSEVGLMREKPAQAAESTTSPVSTQTPNNQSMWQQVSNTKKGHKKNKSSTGTKTVNGHNGQPLPANENERKGG